MTQALATLAVSDWGDFVIFEDLQTMDYVQLEVAPFVGEADGSVPCHVSLPLTVDESIPKAQMEVMDRGGVVMVHCLECLLYARRRSRRSRIEALP